MKKRKKNHAGLFKKGMIPWNKNTVGIKKATGGSFKKGHIPKNKFSKGHIPWIAGKKHSKETIKKLRELSIRRGCKPPSRKGIKLTEFQKKALKEGCINHFKKIRNQGKCISSVVQLLRKCQKYIYWRMNVFIRDNFTCQKCLAKSGNGYVVYLEVHHIISFHKLVIEAENYMPLINLYDACLIYLPLWDIKNGITLCDKCHQRKGRPQNEK